MPPRSEKFWIRHCLVHVGLRVHCPMIVDKTNPSTLKLFDCIVTDSWFGCMIWEKQTQIEKQTLHTVSRSSSSSPSLKSWISQSYWLIDMFQLLFNLFIVRKEESTFSTWSWWYISLSLIIWSFSLLPSVNRPLHFILLTMLSKEDRFRP